MAILLAVLLVFLLQFVLGYITHWLWGSAYYANIITVPVGFYLGWKIAEQLVP